MPNALVATGKEFTSFLSARFSKLLESENGQVNLCEKKLYQEIELFINSEDFQIELTQFVYSTMNKMPELEKKNKEAYAFLSNLCQNTLGKPVEEICELVKQQLESQNNASPRPYGM